MPSLGRWANLTKYKNRALNFCANWDPIPWNCAKCDNLLSHVRPVAPYFVMLATIVFTTMQKTTFCRNCIFEYFHSPGWLSSGCSENPHTVVFLWFSFCIFIISVPQGGSAVDVENLQAPHPIAKIECSWDTIFREIKKRWGVCFLEI